MNINHRKQNEREAEKGEKEEQEEEIITGKGDYQSITLPPDR